MKNLIIKLLAYLCLFHCIIEFSHAQTCVAPNQPILMESNNDKVSFKWNKITNAISYEWRITRNGSVNFKEGSTINTEVSNIDVPQPAQGELPARFVEISVRTKCANGVSAWSEVLGGIKSCPDVAFISGGNTVNVGSTLILPASGGIVTSSDTTIAKAINVLNLANLTNNIEVTGIKSGTVTIRTRIVPRSGVCQSVFTKTITVTNPITISFDPSKCYRIINKATNKVLEIRNNSQLEGEQIYQWTTSSSRKHQTWQINSSTNGTFTFTSKSSGKLIDAPDCTSGAIIKQYAADGTNSQKWKLEKQSDGSYKILNLTCNQYLRVDNNSQADGGNVGIRPDYGGENFKWFIEETPCSQAIDPAKCYQIFNRATNKVMELKSGTLDIQQWEALSNRPNQIWKFDNTTYNGSGTLLTVQGGYGTGRFGPLNYLSPNNCANLYVIDQGYRSATWILELGSDGFFKMKSTLCNKYLRVLNGNTANGASIILDNDFGSNTFKWYVEEVGCPISTALTTSSALLFEAKATENRTQLTWVTNENYQADYFDIEHLNDKGNFEKLDIQNADNNQTGLKSYSFTDNNPLGGDNYYRIKTVYQTAPPQYSEVKKVSFLKTNDVGIFPNPASEYIDLDLRQYEGKAVTIYLYNSLGNMVKKVVVQKASSAPQRLDIQGLNMGTHLLRVQTEGKRDVVKQVIIAE